MNPDTKGPQSADPGAGAPGQARAESARTSGSIRGLLGRLVPRRGLWPGGSTEAADFEASERAAYRSALEFWGGPPLVPAPLKRSPRTPDPRPSRAPTTEPEDVTDAAPDERRSAWATPPGPETEETVRPPEAGSPAARRRPLPGETAPDSLLEAPASVSLAADDFFDRLIRRVEGDR
jgi:hypothetical protein